LTTWSVTATWGDATLRVWHFARSKSFHIGDDPATCEFVVPPEALPEVPFALVDADGSSIKVAESCARDAHRVTLAVGSGLTLRVGDLTFLVTHEPPGDDWDESLRRNAQGTAAYALGAVLFVTAFLFACAVSARTEGARSRSNASMDQMALIRAYLDAADERELRERQLEIVDSPEVAERQRREHARIMKLPPSERRPGLLRACFQRYIDRINDQRGGYQEPHRDDSACRTNANRLAYEDDYYATRDYRQGFRRPPDGERSGHPAPVPGDGIAAASDPVMRAPPYRIALGKVDSTDGGQAVYFVREVLYYDVVGSYMCGEYWRPQPANGDRTLGTLNVALELGPDGVVSSTAVRGYAVANPGHSRCLERYFRDAVFPGIRPGTRVDVTLVLNGV
jgi:hypothetical protein